MFGDLIAMQKGLKLQIDVCWHKDKTERSNSPKVRMQIWTRHHKGFRAHYPEISKIDESTRKSIVWDRAEHL